MLSIILTFLGWTAALVVIGFMALFIWALYIDIDEPTDFNAWFN